MSNPYFVPIVQPVGINTSNGPYDDSKDPITTLVPPIVQPVYVLPNVSQQLKDIKKNNNGKLYFPAPPFINSHYKYQNVNADKKLQHMVTTEFHNMLKNIWLKEELFKKFNKKSKELKSKDEGYLIVHKILRLYIKQYNQNWYDLELQVNNVKQFIYNKLEQLIF